MIDICGYNLCFDIDSLNIMPTNLNNINNVKIQNGIYDEINITKDVTYEYTTTIPLFDFNTILQCKFEGNINGGNTNFTMNQINAIRIKKRLKNSSNPQWVRVCEDIQISTYEDLLVNVKDYYTSTETEYEYAVIPMLNNVEGNYITNNIKTKFNGIFICDRKSVYKLYSGVSYGNTTNNKQIGTLIPIGKKYPIIVSNSSINYKTGSVSGQILQSDFKDTRKINRKQVVDLANELTEYLLNGSPKIIKDWNGNIWLVMIETADVNYNSNYGMGIINISFNWAEQGDVNSEEDLIANGMI